MAVAGFALPSLECVSQTLLVSFYSFFVRLPLEPCFGWLLNLETQVDAGNRNANTFRIRCICLHYLPSFFALLCNSMAPHC